MMATKRTRAAAHRPAVRRRRFRHDTLTALDLFSGFGGLTQGIERAGFDVITAANHNAYKVEVHEANHPTTEHWIADLANPESADYHYARDLPPADLLARRRLVREPLARQHDEGLRARPDVVRAGRPRLRRAGHPVGARPRDGQLCPALRRDAPPPADPRRVHDRAAVLGPSRSRQAEGRRRLDLPLVAQAVRDPGLPAQGAVPELDVLRGRAVPRPRLLGVLGQDRSPGARPGAPAADLVRRLRDGRRGRLDLEDRHPATGSVCYGKQYEYRCPSCRRRSCRSSRRRWTRSTCPTSVPASVTSRSGRSRTARPDRWPPTTMARAERCRQRFARVPRRAHARQGHARQRAAPVAADVHPDQPAGDRDPVHRRADGRCRELLRAPRLGLPHPRPVPAAPGTDSHQRDRADHAASRDRHRAGDGCPPPQRRRAAHHLPMDTVTATHEKAVLLAVDNFQGVPRGAAEPLPTQGGSETMALLSSGVVPFRQEHHPDDPRRGDADRHVRADPRAAVLRLVQAERLRPPPRPRRTRSPTRSAL